MSFAHPWVLLALWPALLAAWWWHAILRKGDRPVTPFLNGEMAKRLAPPSNMLRTRSQWALVFAGLILGLLALAAPRWGEREDVIMEKGRDVVVALDVSRSMLARDVRPNRLLRAKVDVMDLMRSLRGDRAALLVFRGSAVALCPLTTDYAYLEQALDDANVDSAPPGPTDLGDAVEKALALFDEQEGGHRAIVLITDGEDLAGRVLRVAEYAAKQGVAIFTVGLGDASGATIPLEAEDGGGVMQHEGRDVLTKMEGETLQRVAEITGGAYVPVGLRNVNLGSLYSERLTRLAARDIEETLLRRQVERYQWFLLPCVLFLLAATCLSRGRLTIVRPASKKSLAKKTVSRGARAVSVTVLAACLATSAAADDTTTPPISTNRVEAVTKKTSVPPGREGARQAQALYNAAHYKEAAAAYHEAAAGQMPALRRMFLFNAACAEYAAGDFLAAAALFREIDDPQAKPAESADIHHNLGCSLAVLAEQGQHGTNPVEAAKSRARFLEQAGVAFQAALRDDSTRKATRGNLAVVTQTLAQARAEARMAELAARYGNKQAPELADMLLQAQRAALAGAQKTLTNATPARIQMFEALAGQQSQSADIPGPLKNMLLATAQQQGMPPSNIAELVSHVDALESVIRMASAKLRDLDENALDEVARSEKGAYLLWQAVADYAMILREDISRQTNSMEATRRMESLPSADVKKAFNDEQVEAVRLTEMFSERFALAYPENASNAVQALPAQAVPQDADTPDDDQEMTPEKREQIMGLARLASASQRLAVEKMRSGDLAASLTRQEDAYAKLKEIEELLPKNKQQQQSDQGSQQPQQDKDKQEDDQNKDQQQDQQQEQQQDQQEQDQQEQENEQPQPQPEPEQAEEQQAEPEQKSGDEMSEDQAREVLMKALQREKEHLDEKRRQEQRRMTPVDRDW